MEKGQLNIRISSDQVCVTAIIPVSAPPGAGCLQVVMVEVESHLAS